MSFKKVFKPENSWTVNPERPPSADSGCRKAQFKYKILSQETELRVPNVLFLIVVFRVDGKSMQSVHPVVKVG